MTRREANDLFGWLRDSYPRNYATADQRRVATIIDNLARVFAGNTFTEVLAEYQRVYGIQKTEPHPSEIRAAIRGDVRRGPAADQDDPYEKLKRHPRWPEFCRAYGARACRRAVKLCVVKGSVDELKYWLEHDMPCTEKDYSEIIAKYFTRDASGKVSCKITGAELVKLL